MGTDCNDGSSSSTSVNQRNENRNDNNDELGFSSRIYKMDHGSRGVAIIFNHDSFKQNAEKSREGSAKDRNDLEACLKLFGYDVRIRNNLTEKGIAKVLKEVAKEDHESRDSLILVVMSHGNDKGEFADHVGSWVSIESLWEPFMGKKCKGLIGKPKLLIIQACRGSLRDKGESVRKTRAQLKVDSNPFYKPSQRIPTSADFLLAFATVPDYVSYRHESQGSWFIQSICKLIPQCCLKEGLDLISALTLVAQRVARMFTGCECKGSCPQTLTPKLKSGQNCKKKYCPNPGKQVPQMISTLTRFIKFPSELPIVPAQIDAEESAPLAVLLEQNCGLTMNSSLSIEEGPSNYEDGKGKTKAKGMDNKHKLETTNVNFVNGNTTPIPSEPSKNIKKKSEAGPRSEIPKKRKKDDRDMIMDVNGTTTATEITTMVSEERPIPENSKSQPTSLKEFQVIFLKFKKPTNQTPQIIPNQMTPNQITPNQITPNQITPNGNLINTNTNGNESTQSMNSENFHRVENCPCTLCWYHETHIAIYRNIK